MTGFIQKILFLTPVPKLRTRNYFELQTYCYIHYRSRPPPWEKYEPSCPISYGLDSITAVLLQVRHHLLFLGRQLAFVSE